MHMQDKAHYHAEMKRVEAELESLKDTKAKLETRLFQVSSASKSEKAILEERVAEAQQQVLTISAERGASVGDAGVIGRLQAQVGELTSTMRAVRDNLTSSQNEAACQKNENDILHGKLLKAEGLAKAGGPGVESALVVAKTE